MTPKPTTAPEQKGSGLIRACRAIRTARSRGTGLSESDGGGTGRSDSND
ncbi:hypothetical protein [Streptomyces sp. NPDC020965]